MIDIEIIKENYSNMSDVQLFAIAKADGHDLTVEAFELLKGEFKKRSLDYSYIESAEQTKASIYAQKIQMVRDSVGDDFEKALWKYILEEKEKGTANADILKGIEERGLDEENVRLMLNGLKLKLIEIINHKDNKMSIGGIAFVAGIFITFLTYSQAKIAGGAYFIAWGAVVFGGIRFFTGMSEKRKYKRVLVKTEQEENNSGASYPGHH